MAALLATVSEILLKKGAMSGTSLVGVMGSFWVWIAIPCYISSFYFWFHALRALPLNIAYNLASLEQAFIPLAAWWVLGEKISPMRWVGILLLLIGVCVIAKPMTRLEEKL